MMARASATRCRWPPESFARVALQQIAELHLGRGIADLPVHAPACGTFRTFSGKPMFSATVLCG